MRGYDYEKQKNYRHWGCSRLRFVFPCKGLLIGADSGKSGSQCFSLWCSSTIGRYWWNELQTMFTNAYGDSFAAQRELEYRSLQKTIDKTKTWWNTVDESLPNYTNGKKKGERICLSARYFPANWILVRFKTSGQTAPVFVVPLNVTFRVFWLLRHVTGLPFFKSLHPNVVYRCYN